MAYEKNVWQDGDIITAEKLNNIEEGIANSNEGESQSGQIVFGKVRRGSMGEIVGIDGFTFRDIVPEDVTDFNDFVPSNIFVLMFSTGYTGPTKIFTLSQIGPDQVVFLNVQNFEKLFFSSNGSISTE